MKREKVLSFLQDDEGGPFRPEESRGRIRTEPRTDEEIIDFMEKCTRSNWAEGFSRAILDYIKIRVSPENRMRAAETTCAGVISKPILAGQTRQDILDVWQESSVREQMLEEGF